MPEMKLEKLAYKSGRVVVLDGLRIAERFQNRVGLQELLLELTLKYFELN